MCISLSHDNRAHEAHFLMQNTNRIGRRIIRTEGVGTDKLSQSFGLVHICFALRAHFMEHNADPSFCTLPSGFTASEAATDDVNLFCHAASPLVRLFSGPFARVFF